MRYLIYHSPAELGKGNRDAIGRKQAFAPSNACTSTRLYADRNVCMHSLVNRTTTTTTTAARLAHTSFSRTSPVFLPCARQGCALHLPRNDDRPCPSPDSRRDDNDGDGRTLPSPSTFSRMTRHPALSLSQLTTRR